MKIFTLCLLSLITVSAGETWTPAEHPAKLTRSISSFTEPSATLMIKAEYPSRLISFSIQENQEIRSKKKGSVLIAQQDTDLIQLELQTAQASLDLQKQLLQTRFTQQKIQKRQVLYRKVELNRFARALEKKAIPQSDYDLALFEYDQSKLSLEEMGTNIALQKKTIQQQEILLATVKEKLDRHSIYAPQGWVLNQRVVEPGTWLRAGDNIAELVYLAQMSAHFRLSEKEFLALQKVPLQIKVKATGKVIKAKLHRLDLNFDPISRKRLVELRLDSKDLHQASGGLELELLLSLTYPGEAVEVPEKFIK